MKKIILTACLIVGSLACFAQTDSPISFGIKGGINFSNLQQSSSGSSSTTASGSLTSFHAGVFADFKVSDAISVQPQLLYTGKGASNKENDSEDGFSASDNVKLNLYYLHLPVYALYHAPVGDNDFFIGAGPFISYGLSGNEKGSVSFSGDDGSGSGTTTQTENINQKVDFGSSDSTGIKRMDYGASVMAGFKFRNGFLISASYDLGLANIAPGGEADIKTRVFSVSVGYSF
jgi:hypothetical protein